MTVSARLRERSRLRVYLRLKRRQSCAWSFGRLQVRVTVIYSELSEFVGTFVQRLDAGASVSNSQRSLKHKLKNKNNSVCSSSESAFVVRCRRTSAENPSEFDATDTSFFVIALSTSRATQPIVVPVAIPLLPAISPFRLRRSLLS